MYLSITGCFLAAIGYVAPIPNHVHLMFIARVYPYIANHQSSCLCWNGHGQLAGQTMLCGVPSLSTIIYSMIHKQYKDNRKYWDAMGSILPTV